MLYKAQHCLSMSIFLVMLVWRPDSKIALMQISISWHMVFNLSVLLTSATLSFTIASLAFCNYSQLWLLNSLSFLLLLE